jgi:hypothetical protein
MSGSGETEGSDHVPKRQDAGLNASGDEREDSTCFDEKELEIKHDVRSRPGSEKRAESTLSGEPEE